MHRVHAPGNWVCENMGIVLLLQVCMPFMNIEYLDPRETLGFGFANDGTVLRRLGSSTLRSKQPT